MIGRLDRYVARVFVMSLAAGILFAAGLLILTDQFQHFDDMLDAPAKLRARGEHALAGAVVPMIIQFYIYEIAIRFFQFAPFVTFFAAVFTAARLHRSHETVAMLASGVSLHRGFACVFLGAAAIAGIQLSFREWLLPRFAEEQASLRAILIDAQPGKIIEKLTIVDAAGNRVHFDKYSPPDRAGRGMNAYAVSGLHFKSVTATEARYQQSTAGGGWTLANGRLFVMTRGGPVPSESTAVDTLPPEFLLRPEDCGVAARAADDPSYLSISELDRLARGMRAVPKYQVALHGAITGALANIILPLMGLPCVLRADRRSTLEGSAVAFVFCIVYFAATLFCLQLGSQEVLGSVFAAWLPTVIFASLGIVLFEAMRT